MTITSHAEQSGPERPFYSGAFDGDGSEYALPVPEDLRAASYGVLGEMLPELRQGFEPYWQATSQRIKQEGGVIVRDKADLNSEEKRAVERARRFRSPDPVILDEGDRLTGFARATRFLHVASETLLALDEAEPGQDILFVWDVDQTMGEAPESTNEKIAEKMSWANDPKRTEEERRSVSEECLKLKFQNFVFNPAVAPFINWTQRHFVSIRGNHPRVPHKVLSTNAQAGLDKWFYPELDALVPGTFAQGDIISSTDGPLADRFVEERKRIRAASRVSPLSLKEMLASNRTDAYGVGDVLLDFDSKYASSTGHDDLKIPALLHLLRESGTDTSIVVLDDYRLGMYLKPNTRLVAAPINQADARFLLPDSPFLQLGLGQVVDYQEEQKSAS